VRNKGRPKINARLDRDIPAAVAPIRSGPLGGIRVVEFSGLGPAPFCAMLLADMGAEVLRIDRPDAAPSSPRDVLGRGKAALRLDLKDEADRDLILRLLTAADVLLEGFRPGVMERLGLGPEPVQGLNPRLIYGRMTGWGQDGPLSRAVGHDLNFVAVAGALGSIGPADGPPIPPLNLVGDFGGGSMYLAFGIAAALFERETSGLGQVIDAAIVDGVAHLMTHFHQLAAEDVTSMERGRGLLGGAAPFYRPHRCADGRWIAVGPLEPKFYAVLLEKIGVDGDALRAQYDQARWDEAAGLLAAVFATRTRDEWCALLEGSDACVSPVLDFDEVPQHPHMQARAVFTEESGLRQPRPAPRFSRTPGQIAGPPPSDDETGWSLAERWGVRRA